ncbi:MAG: hypothetical protein QOI29_2401 [Mycobacterium sp.]|jgi:hypothetical protein|nr:hypothetical protein [Mycobacterium sp.]
MSNPTGPDQPYETAEAAAEATDDTDETQQADAVTDPGHEPATEILLSPEAEAQLPAEETNQPAARRFTAPSGFDAGATQKIDTPADPATEVMSVPYAPSGVAAATAFTEPMAQQKPVAPQLIPPRTEPAKPPRNRRSWGWVVALLLVIAALVAVAILGTLLLTRGSTPKVSQEDMVRSTIQNFDIAIQNGDLATLRSITCGTTRDSYVNYDERAWTETHARVAAAKQYPVVASIDQVVVNGGHAEANVTTFMAYAPQTRSTRSFDLQFRDDHWKVCQSPDS